jgi:hypothetical protein
LIALEAPPVGKTCSKNVTFSVTVTPENYLTRHNVPKLDF